MNFVGFKFLKFWLFIKLPWGPTQKKTRQTDKQSINIDDEAKITNFPQKERIMDWKGRWVDTEETARLYFIQETKLTCTGTLILIAEIFNVDTFNFLLKGTVKEKWKGV